MINNIFADGNVPIDYNVFGKDVVAKPKKKTINQGYVPGSIDFKNPFRGDLKQINEQCNAKGLSMISARDLYLATMSADKETLRTIQALTERGNFLLNTVVYFNHGTFESEIFHNVFDKRKEKRSVTLPIPTYTKDSLTSFVTTNNSLNFLAELFNVGRHDLEMLTTLSMMFDSKPEDIQFSTPSLDDRTHWAHYLSFDRYFKTAKGPRVSEISFARRKIERDGNDRDNFFSFGVKND